MNEILSHGITYCIKQFYMNSVGLVSVEEPLTGAHFFCSLSVQVRAVFISEASVKKKVGFLGESPTFEPPTLIAPTCVLKVIYLGFFWSLFSVEL